MLSKRGQDVAALDLIFAMSMISEREHPMPEHSPLINLRRHMAAVKPSHNRAALERDGGRYLVRHRPLEAGLMAAACRCPRHALEEGPAVASGHDASNSLRHVLRKNNHKGLLN